MTAFPYIYEQRSIQSIVVQHFEQTLKGFGDCDGLAVTRNVRPAALILSFILMVLPENLKFHA